MKVRIVKEVKRSDDLWRFACGDVFLSPICNLKVWKSLTPLSTPNTSDTLWHPLTPIKSPCIFQPQRTTFKDPPLPTVFIVKEAKTNDLKRKASIHVCVHFYEGALGCPFFHLLTIIVVIIVIIIISSSSHHHCHHLSWLSMSSSSPFSPGR